MYSQDYDSSYIPSASSITVGVSGYNKKINSVAISALLDTGADGTMLPLRLLKRLKAKPSKPKFMRGVMGERQRVNTYLVKIIIGPYEIDGIQAVAIEGNTVEPLIGRDVLQSLIVTFNGLAGVTEIKDTL